MVAKLLFVLVLVALAIFHCSVAVSTTLQGELDLIWTELQAPQPTKAELLEKSLADYLKHDKELIHDLEELGFGKSRSNFWKPK